jgi:DNA polymerase I-like protein with 3'-5' exonuclease and polymerase domains
MQLEHAVLSERPLSSAELALLSIREHEYSNLEEYATLPALRKALLGTKRKPGLWHKLRGQYTRILCVGTKLAQALAPGFVDMRQDHGALFERDGVVLVPTALSLFPNSAAAFAERDVWRCRNVEHARVAVRSWAQLPRVLSGAWAVDIETTANTDNDEHWALSDRSTITAIVLANTQSEAYIAYTPDAGVLRDIAVRLLAGGGTPVVHNAGFDLSFLWRHGGEEWLRLIDTRMFVDTQVLANVAGHEVLSLKHLMSMLTSLAGSHAFGSFRDEQYVAQDACGTIGVYEALRSKAELPASVLMHAALGEAIRLREQGVAVDESVVAQAQAENTAHLERVLSDLHGLVGRIGLDDLRKPRVVAALLRSQGVDVEKVDKRILLEQYADRPLVTKLVEARECMTLDSNFYAKSAALAALGGGGRYRPSLRIVGARTGRTSMSGPNLQNFPSRGLLKAAIVPQEPYDVLWMFDLDYIEMKAAAWLSGDGAFAGSLRTDDPHTANAALALGKSLDQVTKAERKAVKTTGFKLLYGGRARRDDEKRIEQAFFSAFPALAEYCQAQKGATSLASRDALGKLRDLRDIYDFAYQRAVDNRYYDARAYALSSVGRKRLNTPLQAYANYVMLFLYTELAEALRGAELELGRPVGRAAFTVHDSCIGYCMRGDRDAVVHIVQETFQRLNQEPWFARFAQLGLPVTSAIVFGPNWAACESSSAYYAPVSGPHALSS